eukprot:gene8518-10472_t
MNNHNHQNGNGGTTIVNQKPQQQIAATRGQVTSSSSSPSSSNNNNTTNTINNIETTNEDQELSKTLLGEIQYLERILQDLISQRNSNTRRTKVSNEDREFYREGECDGNESEWKREEELLKNMIESKKADFRTFITLTDKNSKRIHTKQSAFLKSGAALSIFPSVVEEKICSLLPLINIIIDRNSFNGNQNQLHQSINNNNNQIENHQNNNNNNSNNHQNNNQNNQNTENNIIDPKLTASLSMASTPIYSICGPKPNLPEDEQTYKNLLCAKSGSSYPKHFTGRRQGDPICDRFKANIYKDKVLVCLADGCSWGRLPYEAATKATDAFLSFLDENHHEINTVRKAGSFLLAAMTAAHKNILAGKSEVWEAGTTTLIGGMLTRIKPTAENDANLKRMSTISYIDTSSSWAFIGATLGDCKAFHYSKKENVFTDITKGNRTNLTDARDPGGRLGPYVGHGEPDLRNLSVFYKLCDEGDMILLLSDGVHDNLDPQQLGLKPNDFGINSDSWDKSGQDFPNETEAAKNDYRKKWLSDHFKNEEDLQPIRITNLLLKHCIDITQTSRHFMETNTSKKLPCDYNLYPGKMDHNTCICFRVGYFN